MPQKLDKHLNAVGRHEVTDERRAEIRASKDAIRTAKGRTPGADEPAKQAKAAKPAKDAAKA